MAPALAYATLLGGWNAEYGDGIAVDESGAAYVTGSAYSSNFPTTPGAYDTSHNGDFDAFAAKLSPDGSTLLYATFLGGNPEDGGWGIAVDASGSAHVTGFTESGNFPTTSGAYDVGYNGNTDAFVAKVAVGGVAKSPRADPVRSMVVSQPALLPADGTTTANLTVQLLSADGTPA